jgi:hypothetical protein|nr:MAG TPA: baseplate protein [Ackermannviridae sp.]
MISPTNLRFWFGIIEGVNDPLQNGRYQVRVFGHNIQDAGILPTEDLPWFPILSQGAASQGMGFSPTFYQVGTHVLGAYLDEDQQNGIIFGSFHSLNGLNDVAGIARGEDIAGVYSNCGNEQGPDSANPDSDNKDNDSSSESPQNTSDSTDKYTIPPKSRQHLEEYLTNSNVRAFLRLIKQTEGTYLHGGNSYDGAYSVLVGGNRFSDFSKHPNRKIRLSSTLTSSAAGAYQYMGYTWNGDSKGPGISNHRKKFGINDFSPRSQDLACMITLSLVRKAIKLIIDGKFKEAIIICSYEWASFPPFRYGGQGHQWSMKRCLDFLKSQGANIPQTDYDSIKGDGSQNSNIVYNEDGTVNQKATAEAMANNCGIDGVPFPQTSGNAQYPYNRTFTSASGHMWEFDDTPGNERVNIYHKSGSFMMMDHNGNVFHKAKNDDYTFIGGEKNEIVTDSRNIKVMGNCNLNIDGIWNVKAAAANFDIPVIRQAGEYYCNEQYVLGTKWTTHIHTNVVMGSDLSSIPVIAGVSVDSMRVEDATFGEVPLTKEQTNRMVADGLMTKEDAEAYHKKPESPDEKPKDESDGGNVPMQSVDCGLVPRDSRGNLNLNAPIGRYLKVGQCVTGSHQFKAQKGLTINQIYCNMKNVVENCFDIIKKHFPDATISSGFRNGTNNSQHNKGEALDIVFTSRPKSSYYEVAKKIKDLVPFDQLLLEYRGTSSAWIHISLKKNDNNRKQILTLVNDRTYSKGLVNYFGSKK